MTRRLPLLKGALAAFGIWWGLAAGDAHAGTGGGGSQTTFTTSTTHHSTFTRKDLPTESLETFLTRLTGHIDGGPNLVDFSFDKPFADPVVQAAIDTVKNNLSAFTAPDPLSFTGPNPLSSMRSLIGSQTDFLGNPLNHTEQTVTTTSSFGPGTILIGDDQSQTFFVAAGTENFNTNTHTESFFDQLFQTTDTFQLKQQYGLEGDRSQAPIVPEPSSFILLGSGLLGLASWRRRKPH